MARRQQPPYLEIAAIVRDKITNGELLPGEQVPSAAELAEAHGVSRGTALRALRVLKDEGTITVVQGWGSFVAER
jgi:DNA-binding GntR family transcriptional regulator